MAGVVAGGEWVIISTNDEKRLVRADSNGKIHFAGRSYPGTQIVGLPYGVCLAEDNGVLCASAQTREEINGEWLEWHQATEPSDEQRTNQELFDDGTAQALSAEEIRELKRKGVKGEELVNTIVKHSSTFQGKTAFAQHKYVKKKSRKYKPVVQIMRTTPLDLLEAATAFEDRRERVHHLREDTLGLVVARSNARPGSRVLIVDTSHGGICIGALAYRLGGAGELLIAHAKPFVPAESCRHLNLPREHWRSILAAPLDDVLDVLEHGDGGGRQPPGTSGPEPATAPSAPKAAPHSLHPDATRQWLSEGCDSLVVVMRCTTPDLLRTLLKAVRPSGSVVAYNACMQPLVECMQACMARDSDGLIRAQIVDTWMREYQVLPNRTHPRMSAMQTSGFILSGFARRRAADVGACPPTEVSGADGVGALQTAGPLAKAPRAEVNGDTGARVDADEG